MAKQKIVSIEIELKDYEPIKFTMAEAKELHEQLDALFGKKETHNHYHRDWWYRPYYTWTNASGSIIANNKTTTAVASAVDWIGRAGGSTVESSNTGMRVSYSTQ